MSDYMGISDIFFTKSGSVSVGEALYMNIPLLLDATASVLPWEKFNHGFVEEKGLGKSIKSYADIPCTIDALLANNGIKLAILRQRLISYALKDGNNEIKKLLDRMCAEALVYNLPSVLSAPMLYTFEKKKA
jgi:UDP-N-acetylglucosamine:LPS N-acetylglucosamine transferase